MGQKQQSFFNDSVKLREPTQQKRKKARTNVSIDASFMLGGKGNPYPCTVTDVGTGGLAIVSRTSLYENDGISIDFKLGSYLLGLKAVVSRVAGKSIGLQYVNIDDRSMAQIQDYIHTSFFEKDRKKN